MLTKSPCFDEATRTDCPNRHVGCRDTCEAWKEYEIVHAQEKAAIANAKARDMDIEGFMSEQYKRDALWKKNEREKQKRRK